MNNSDLVEIFKNFENFFENLKISSNKKISELANNILNILHGNIQSHSLKEKANIQQISNKIGKIQSNNINLLGFGDNNGQNGHNEDLLGISEKPRDSKVSTTTTNTSNSLFDIFV